jgi:23S rRNA (cytidine1920-2'-O)/16S rRNA (cytidine1409-2'-O)-methyltransferase
MRADLRLVELGLASSRTRAQELISAGRVFVVAENEKILVNKSSLQLTEDVQLEVTGQSEEFVSRGGVKMQGALLHTGLKVEGFTVLDVGISTGGFSDCLLQMGAARIVGVDVGHDQLHEKLKNDKRVEYHEGINARSLEIAENPEFDLIVVDVSFISLTLVIDQVVRYLKDSGRLLCLVKPQFEVGREGLGKNGIVKNAGLYDGVEKKIKRAVASAGLKVEDYFASSIEGSDGNREFFVYARKS